MARLSQRSLHNASIFRLLLKVAVNGTHQCDFLIFCGASRPNIASDAASVVTVALCCLSPPPPRSARPRGPDALRLTPELDRPPPGEHPGKRAWADAPAERSPEVTKSTPEAAQLQQIARALARILAERGNSATSDA